MNADNTMRRIRREQRRVVGDPQAREILRPIGFLSGISGAATALICRKYC